MDSLEFRMAQMGIRAKVADEFNESDHPRADNGQFGSGGGGKSHDPLVDKTTVKEHMQQKAKERETSAPQPDKVTEGRSKFAGLNSLRKGNSFEEIMKKVEAEKKEETIPHKPNPEGLTPHQEKAAKTTFAEFAQMHGMRLTGMSEERKADLTKGWEHYKKTGKLEQR